MPGIQTEPKPHCPECGARMCCADQSRIRIGSHSGAAANTQTAKGTRQINPDGTPEDDAGDLMPWDL